MSSWNTSISRKVTTRPKNTAKSTRWSKFQFWSKTTDLFWRNHEQFPLIWLTRGIPKAISIPEILWSVELLTRDCIMTLQLCFLATLTFWYEKFFFSSFSSQLTSQCLEQIMLPVVQHNGQHYLWTNLRRFDEGWYEFFYHLLLISIFFLEKHPMVHSGDAKVPAEKRENMKNVLSTLNSFLEGSEWIAGKNATIADFSVLSNIIVILVSVAGVIDVVCFNFRNSISECRHQHWRIFQFEAVVRTLQKLDGIRWKLRGWEVGQ